MYVFQSESTLYSCLNVKELLARRSREIWSLSDCNWTRNHNHLVRKRKLNLLVKLASLVKWLSVPLRTKWLWVRVQLQSLNRFRNKKKAISIKCQHRIFQLLSKTLKANQTLSERTYSSLTPLYCQRMLKYFNNFHNWHLSISMQKWVQTSTVK